MDGRWDKLVPYVRQLQPDFCEVGGETDSHAMIETLGPTAVLQGGVPAEIARTGTPGECAQVVTDVLATANGRAQVALTVANEVHLGTPLENIQAIMQAVRARGSVAD